MAGYLWTCVCVCVFWVGWKCFYCYTHTHTHTQTKKKRIMDLLTGPEQKFNVATEFLRHFVFFFFRPKKRKRLFLFFFKKKHELALKQIDFFCNPIIRQTSFRWCIVKEKLKKFFCHLGSIFLTNTKSSMAIIKKITFFFCFFFFYFFFCYHRTGRDVFFFVSLFLFSFFFLCVARARRWKTTAAKKKEKKRKRNEIEWKYQKIKKIKKREWTDESITFPAAVASILLLSFFGFDCITSRLDWCHPGTTDSR